MEQEHPGERRERRFARPEKGGRQGPLASAEVAATTAAPPSTSTDSPPAAPEAPSAGGEGAASATEGEIMTKLPRSRPERRSTRRTGATTRRRAAARPASSRKRAATKQPQRGLRDQITDATIQTATMPFKATFALARRAGRLIGRLR